MLFGFKSQKKLFVSSQYWFPAQQQTSNSRQQNSKSISSKFSVEESKCTLAFWNPLEVAKKLQKPNNVSKT